MILYGASGHGKAIFDLLESSGVKVIHFFDDNNYMTNLLDVNISNYCAELYKNSELVISIGNNAIRKQVSQKVKHIFGVAIHKSAILSGDVIIGSGSVIMQGVIIQTQVVVGEHVIVNTASSVDHESIIGNFVHISPHVAICGNVKVDEGTFIGAGAVVTPNVSIGKWCTIKAGSVITENIPDYAIVESHPFKIIGYNEHL